jgi:hypothetical protein
MIIPKRLTIGRKRYVVYNPLKLTQNAYGHCYPVAGVISVAQTHRQKPRTLREQGGTFWHELTHCILHDMGHTLWRNEPFVREFSERLSQAVHTAKLE